MVRKLLYLLIFSYVLLLFTQCSEEVSERKELSKLLESEFNAKLNNEIQRIFILNDTKCTSCVYTFSQYIKEHVNDPNSLVILQTRGHNIDIDGFMEKRKTNPNIYISHQINNENKYLSDLSVIFLNENAIDTIIKIIPGKVNEQIEYIFK